MAHNPTTDLTEEDAADLQFPKESVVNNYYKTKMNKHVDDTIGGYNSSRFAICDICLKLNSFCICEKCLNCENSLSVPFIECTHCENVNLCCTCFAFGREFSTHESNHSYRVIQHNFELFEHSGWTAAEELTLLDVLSTYGYGCWELVANKLKGRNTAEIKQHYDRFYIDCPVNELLPKVQETKYSLFPNPVIPYRFKLIDINEPPRYAPFTVGFQSVAGYNAARSDFDVEFDANAEQILAHIGKLSSDPFDPQIHVLRDLQCAVIRIYNKRLRERQRRKDIIRNHGLILLRKTVSWMYRYDKTLTRRVTERLMVFMQFFTAIKFDLFMEGLNRVAELKQKIVKLNEYRRKGIKTLQSAEVYESINQEREKYKKELSLFTLNPRFNWKSLDNSMQRSISVPNKRAQFRPLDVLGLPGYEKLTKEEQELCSAVRLVPQSYIELRDILVNENKKLGYLHLKTARKMLKIDVNKTRKLYDFLLVQGFIVKPLDICN